ncbi:MAG: BatD family protein [Phototrophicaceae bacterium]
MCRLVLFLLLFAIVPIAEAQTRPFAESVVDNDAPYIGQRIIYTLRVYSENSFDDSIVTEPDFVGFGRSSISLEPIASTETIEGITYYVIEQRYVIYPLRAGALTIDPFQIEIPATPFAPEWLVSTNAVNLTVQTYPEPVPDNFTNGIGQFSIDADATPTTLQSGDALTVRVAVSGTGNLEQLLAPILNVPETWRIFDNGISYQQDTSRFGTATFEWTVIVEGDGEASFPAIVFSYFNPQNEQYETRNTAPIALTILASTPAPIATIEPEIAIEQTVIIPELLSSADMQTILPQTMPLWFWILWIIPPLISFILWIASQRVAQTKPIIVSKRQRSRTKSNALKGLFKQLSTIEDNNPTEAYQKLSDAIYGYLGVKTGLSVTLETIDIALAQIPEQYQQPLVHCLDELSAGQYAPITAKDVQQLKHQIKRLCSAIEKASL